MTEIRVSHAVVEVANNLDAGEMRATHAVVEVAANLDIGLMMATHVVVEVVYGPPQPTIHTHGVAMPGYEGDLRGEPEPGDRAAWDTENYPEHHASDLAHDAPTCHNPWPAAAGTAPVSNGSEYVPTDVATQAELDAHAANVNAHHAKSHAHDGADGSGTVAHSATTGRTANDHHAQSHNLFSADHPDVDHTDTPTEGQVLTYVQAAGKWRAEDPSGGGSPLTVKEEDGDPTVNNVTEIRVSNGTLTDNGSGSVSIQTGGGGGGGGGAPVDASYIVEDANDTLTNERVLGTTVITTAPYASRQAAATAGRLFLPNNGVYLERDTGAAWVPWGPLFPFVTPVNGDFSWVNQGSATVSTTNGGIALVGATGGNLQLCVKAAPSVPYTITAAFLMSALPANAESAGLCWRQSSDGKIVIAAIGRTSSANFVPALLAQKWTNATTFSAAYSATSLYLVPLFLRIADDSTNRIISISADGVLFYQIHSVGRTDYLTADQVGFFVNAAAQIMLLSWREG